jgi:chromosome segregation ATPase
MPKHTRASLLDRLEALSLAQAEAQRELERLQREEQYLASQIDRAEEQVRYYEGLLVELKRDWGQDPALKTLVRRLS